MHLAARLVADWIEDATYGVNAIAPNVPRLTGDSAPASVTVYDELTDEWLALGQLPAEEHDANILYPCALVLNGAGRFTDGLGSTYPTGRHAEGTVSVVVQLVVRDTDAAVANRQLMYLVRATRAALMSFSDTDPVSVAARTDDALGIRLEPAVSVDVRSAVFPMGDDLATVALVVSFPVLETTVLR